MKVKFIGFGGYMNTPVYENEQGKLFFDENNGYGQLDLYTGAYRDKYLPEDICGEPCDRITEPIECDEPYRVHPKRFKYQMLDRLKSDCYYFLGNGYEGHLYYHEVDKHIDEMKKLWEQFTDEEKPEWLSMEDIEKLHVDMKEKLTTK